MSYDLVVNQVLEAKFYSTNRGQYAINTRHYRVTTIAGTSESDVNAAIKLSDYFHLLLKNCMCDDATFLGVSVQIVSFPRRPKAVITGDNGAGQFVGEPLPRQVAGLITLLTDEASRHGRGRMYVPFPPESANTATGVPSGDYIAALDSLALKLDDTITVGVAPNTATIQPVVYNRATHAVLPITNTRVAGVWATQRRRSDIRGGDRPPI